MRWLLRGRIDRDGEESLLSRILGEIESGELNDVSPEWLTVVEWARAGRISHALPLHRRRADRLPVGTDAFLLSPSESLDAVAAYCRAFIGLADSEILFPYLWTELEIDGQTTDPAGWWDWLNATLHALVVRSEPRRPTDDR